MRSLYAAVLVAAGLLLAGCTGASTGRPDPNAVDPAINNGADAVTPYLVTYGKPIGALILVVVVVGIVRALWRNMMVRLVGACIIVGMIVWQIATSVK